MNITDIRVRLVKKSEGRLKGVVSIIIDDCFAVHDIKIIDGNEGYFIAMPSRKTPNNKYTDIAHPIVQETRAMLQEKILAAFDDALEADAELEATVVAVPEEAQAEA